MTEPARRAVDLDGRPLIERTFPFDETLEALAYVEQGRARGKVVVTHL